MVLTVRKYWLPIWLVLVITQYSRAYFDYTDFSNDLLFFGNNRNAILHQQNRLCNATVNGQTLQGICKRSLECGFNREGVRGQTSECGLISTCCIYSFSCRGTTSAKVSYFRMNPDLSTTTPRSCEYRVQLMDRNICQIRLDFVKMNLAQPGELNGPCIQERFAVPDYPNVPDICGENTGQHMYVQVQGAQTTQVRLRVDYQTTTANWLIKVTQLYCPGLSSNSLRNQQPEIARDFPLLAPDNCLQYYTDTQGQFSSFGYNPVLALSAYSRPLAYSICFKRSSPTSPCIRFRQEDGSTIGDTDYLYASRISSTVDPPLTEGRLTGAITAEFISRTTGPYVVEFIAEPPATPPATPPTSPAAPGFRINYDTSGANCG